MTTTLSPIQFARRAVERALEALEASPNIRVTLRARGFLRGDSSPGNCPVFHYLKASIPPEATVSALVGTEEVHLTRYVAGGPYETDDVSLPSGVRTFVRHWDAEKRVERLNRQRVEANRNPFADLSPSLDLSGSMKGGYGSSIPNEISSPFGDLG